MSDGYDLRLLCTDCLQPREYDFIKRTGDGGQIVKCSDCGKRHSDLNIRLLYTYRAYTEEEIEELLTRP